MDKCNITPTLLVSRINGIKVRQVGTSTLQSTNNHVNDHKIGISFLGNGENRTVDLGKGEKKYSITVETDDHIKSKALKNICENIRYCTITDKWKGRIKAYITDYSVIDSDEHMNVTIFKINFSEQDESSTPLISFFSFFLNIFGLIDTLIFDSIVLLNTFDKLTAYSMHTSLQDDLGSLIIDLMDNTLDPLSNSKFEHFEKLNDVRSYVALLSAEPAEMGKRLSNFLEIKSDTILDLNVRVLPLQTFELPEKSLVSQIEFNKSLLENEFTRLKNLFILKNELSMINNATFASQEQFENFIDSAIERSYALELDIDITSTLRQYASEKSYNDVETVTLDNESLVPFIYYKYGNLDRLDEIILLNNLPELDLISGELKVYR